MKATWDKFDDFRETMKEIVGSSADQESTIQEDAEWEDRNSANL